MIFSKYINFFIKELIKINQRLQKFFAIFISLLIFLQSQFLKNSIESQINNNSRVLLGGDVELSTKNKP